ncbi:thioredoxin family protein [Chloroflexota bacterium]
MSDAPKIEFLFWQDCPSHPAAQERLEEVMIELGVEAPVHLIDVLEDEDADRLGFPGSPTIRVDGVDIDPDGAEAMGTALTCRIYRLEDGRFSPIPSKEMIRRALT